MPRVPRLAMAQPLIHIAAPAVERASLRVVVREHALAGVSTAVLLTAAGAARGSYFPGSWGWLTVACAWAGLLVLVLDADAAIGRLARWTLAGWTGVALWTLASALWSQDVTQSALEVQRDLVYVAAFAAAVLLGRRAPAALLGGALAAVSALCAYALATRLFPDRIGVVDVSAGYRLSEPIGYWNSLGLVAAMGSVLALGLAARSRSLLGRAASAAPLPLLLPTLLFTFSRGAWAAGAAGLLGALLLDRRRLQLLAVGVPLAVPSALAVAIASHRHALTTIGTPLALQAHEGHRLVLPLLGLALAAAAASLAVALAERRLSPPAYAVRATEATLAAAVVAAILVGVSIYGSPWHVASRAWHGFATSAPASADGPNLEGRLFHLSGSGRLTQWQVAWREVKANPVLGSGAGTYELYWDRDRATGGKVRDVHNLYLETLAELGPIGTALLALALGAPLLAAVRRRRHPLAPVALAAYLAYLVHAIVDWDWEIASVTLVAVVAAATLCCLDVDGEPIGLRLRWAGGSVLLVLALAGIWGIAQQTELSRIDGTPAHATSVARRAADLQPWSTEPWRRLAAVDASAHRYADARAALAHALAKTHRDWSLWFALAQVSNGRERADAMARVAALNPLSPELAGFRATLVSLSQVEGAK